MMNKKRVIKIVAHDWGKQFYGLAMSNNDKDVRIICEKNIHQALGKQPRVGMKLALVDLAEYDIPGVNVNCD